MIDIMNFIFNVCIGVGIILPLLDVLLGFLGSVLNFDFDIGGHHIGDVLDAGVDGGAADSPLPFNIMCLCFGLVVFGAIGKLVAGLMGNVFVAIGLILALLLISVGAYMLLYIYVVKPLKKSNPKAIKDYDLYGSKGKLTLRITTGSNGTVSVKDSTGAMISYTATAKEDVLRSWNGSIPQGAEVMIVDIDVKMKTAYVKPLNTFENNNLKH